MADTLRIKQKRWFQSICFWMVLTVTLGISFYYNVKTPLYADDYTYVFSFYDGSRITSVADILKSLYRHYFIMNGRVVTHFFAHLYLMVNPYAADALNAVSFVVLGLLIWRISGLHKTQTKTAWLALVYCALYWFTPSFGESYLWLDAAATYLLGMVLILAFLLSYVEYLFRPEERDPLSGRSARVLLGLGNLLLGFCAGAASENNSIAMIGMVTALLVIAYVKKRLQVWLLLGWFGSIIGYLFMLLAPGNYNRLQGFDAMGFQGYLQNFLSITRYFLTGFPLPIGICIVSLAVFLRMRKGQRGKQVFQELFLPLVFLMGTGMAAYAMIATPYFPLRAWNGVVVFGIITCGSLLSEIEISGRLCGFYKKMAAGLLIVCTLCSCFATGMHLRDIRRQYDARVVSIQEQIAAGQTEIWVPKIRSTSKYSCFSGDSQDLSRDPENWTNGVMANYWGVSSINRID